MSVCTQAKVEKDLAHVPKCLAKGVSYQDYFVLCWKGWSWTVLWRPTRPSRTDNPKRCPFYHRRLECKNKKSTDSWSNRQVWPWSTKWSRAKANGVLLRECTGRSKHSLPTTQNMTLHMDITRWSIPKSDWLYYLQSKMEKFYTISKNKTGSWLWLRSWTIAKFRFEESRENQ